MTICDQRTGTRSPRGSDARGATRLDGGGWTGSGGGGERGGGPPRAPCRVPAVSAGSRGDRHLRRWRIGASNERAGQAPGDRGSHLPVAPDRRHRQVPQPRGDEALPRGLGRGDGHGGGAAAGPDGARARPRCSHWIDAARMRSCPTPPLCYTADDAVRTCRLAEELGMSEVGEARGAGRREDALPGRRGRRSKAARVLVKEGFTVLPYTSDDPITARSSRTRAARR